METHKQKQRKNAEAGTKQNPGHLNSEETLSMRITNAIKTKAFDTSKPIPILPPPYSFSPSADSQTDCREYFINPQ
jgi:hypothetical protein